VLPLKVADLFQESDDPVVGHTTSREAAQDRFRLTTGASAAGEPARAA
jgi:hypothetical protein